MTHTFDVIILGGGSAGLAAAIYASRAKLKTAVVEENLPGGWMKTTHLVANYPGVHPQVRGADLARSMEEQAKHFGARFFNAVEITQLDLTQRRKYVELDEEQTLTAPAVILAMGQEPRKLGLPGEQAFRGRGLSYCATCDGDFYQDKHVVVIGGGNSALEESIFLTQFARQVTIVHQFDHFQASAVAAEEARANPKISFLLAHEPRAYVGQEKFEGVEVEELATGQRKVIPADGVFVYVGFVPKTALVKGQVRLDDRGYIPTDELMHTSQPGVLAAGDIRVKTYRQITTAVADGTIAALEAEKIAREVKRDGSD